MIHEKQKFPEVPAFEQHHTVTEISTQWSVSDDTIRKLFSDETGVIKIGKPNRRKRKYFTLLVPESVLLRVYQRLQKKAS
jgi:hypothetical protein